MDRRTELLILLNSLEENLQAIRQAIKEETFRMSNGEIDDRTILYRVANIRNDANDFLTLKNKNDNIEGSHSFNSEIKLYNNLEKATNRLYRVCNYLIKEGIVCNMNKYYSLSNVLSISVDLDDAPAIGTIISDNADFIEISYDNYIINDIPGGIGKVREYYKIPMTDIYDVIYEILTMPRPKKLSEIPPKFLLYRQ